MEKVKKEKAGMEELNHLRRSPWVVERAEREPSLQDVTTALASTYSSADLLLAGFQKQPRDGHRKGVLSGSLCALQCSVAGYARVWGGGGGAQHRGRGQYSGCVLLNI